MGGCGGDVSNERETVDKVCQEKIHKRANENTQRRGRLTIGRGGYNMT